MNLIRKLLASIFVLLLSVIISFSWHNILGWRTATNFVTGVCFWIICVLLVALNFVIIQSLNLEVPFKITVISADILYFVVEVISVSAGIFLLSNYIYILIQMILIFIYLVITIPIMLISRPKEGEN